MTVGTPMLRSEALRHARFENARIVYVRCATCAATVLLLDRGESQLGEKVRKRRLPRSAVASLTEPVVWFDLEAESTCGERLDRSSSFERALTLLNLPPGLRTR